MRSATGNRDILGAVIILALSTIPISQSTRVAFILTVTLLLLGTVERSDGLTCYSCEDTGAVQTGNNLIDCYSTPTPLAKTIQCPDSKTAGGYMANEIGYGLDRERLMRGYCAVWILQVEPPKIDGRPGRLDTYWNRGCLYPGGEPNEPDDCLKVEDTSVAKPYDTRTWTAQYCRSDNCNRETFADFANRCFGGGGSNAALTTRDFNNANATLQPPATILPLIIDPKIDALLKARAENVTASDGDHPKGGARQSCFACLDTLALFYVAFVCMHIALQMRSPV